MGKVLSKNATGLCGNLAVPRNTLEQPLQSKHLMSQLLWFAKKLFQCSNSFGSAAFG